MVADRIATDPTWCDYPHTVQFVMLTISYLATENISVFPVPYALHTFAHVRQTPFKTNLYVVECKTVLSFRLIRHFG